VILNYVLAAILAGQPTAAAPSAAYFAPIIVRAPTIAVATVGVALVFPNAVWACYPAATTVRYDLVTSAGIVFAANVTPSGSGWVPAGVGTGARIRVTITNSQGTTVVDGAPFDIVALPSYRLLTLTGGITESGSGPYDYNAPAPSASPWYSEAYNSSASLPTTGHWGLSWYVDRVPTPGYAVMFGVTSDNASSSGGNVASMGASPFGVSPLNGQWTPFGNSSGTLLPTLAGDTLHWWAEGSTEFIGVVRSGQATRTQIAARARSTVPIYPRMLTQEPGGTAAYNLQLRAQPPLVATPQASLSTYEATGRMGANLGGVSYYATLLLYRNIVWQGNVRIAGSSYGKYTGGWNAQGFPTSPYLHILWAGAGHARPLGTYKSRIVFPGSTGAESFSTLVSAATGCSIANPVYQGSGAWTFDVVVTVTSNDLTTDVIAALNVAAGPTAMEVMLPQYTGYKGRTYGPYFPGDSVLWTDEALDVYSQYSTIRGMDFLGGNTNAVIGLTSGEGVDGAAVVTTYTTLTAGSVVSCTIPDGAAYTAGTFRVTLGGSPQVVRTGQPASYTITTTDVTAAGGTIPWAVMIPETTVTYGWDRRIKPVDRLRNVADMFGFSYSHEDFVSLCAALIARPGSQVMAVWPVLPCWGNADYATNCAALYRDLLPSTVKVIVQQSNETWNSQFPQFGWYMMRGNPGDVSSQTGYIRSLQAPYAAFRAAFGESGTVLSSHRVHPVLDTQTANTEAMDEALANEAFSPAGHCRYLSAAFYSGPAVLPAGETTTAAGVLALYNDSLVDLKLKWKTARALAVRLGLSLNAYEGGAHYLNTDSGAGGWASEATQNAAFLLPGMADHIRLLYTVAVESGFEGALCFYRVGPGHVISRWITHRVTPSSAWTETPISQAIETIRYMTVPDRA
jgi:hypothetical protein